MSEPTGRVRQSLFLGALAVSFAQFGVVTALGDVAHHFGHVATSGSLTARVGLSGSVIGVGLAIVRAASLGALFLTGLANRLGRVGAITRWFMVGLFITVLAAASPSYWLFVLCFALARPFLSSVTALIQIVTVELSAPARRVHALSIMAAGTGIGAGLSAIVHGWVRGPSGFRILFGVAVLPLLLLTPRWRVVPEPAVHSDQLLARVGSVSRDERRYLLALSSVTFTLGMISGPAGGFAFVYGESVLLLGAHRVALIVTASGLTGLAGLLVGRSVAHRVSRQPIVVTGTILSAAGSALAYFGGRGAFVAGYLLAIGAGGLVTPAHVALSTESFRHANRAVAAGWILVAGVTGAVVGLATFGVIVNSAGGAHPLRLGALVTFLISLPSLLTLRLLPDRSRLELH